MSVSWASTVPPQNEDRNTKGSTTIASPGVSPSGWGQPGNKYAYAQPGEHGYNRRVPSGTVNANGKLTGDFRGLGVVNPWGGSKRRRHRIVKKSRRVHRRKQSNRRSRAKK